VRFADRGKATLPGEGHHSPTGIVLVAWERARLRWAVGYTASAAMSSFPLDVAADDSVLLRALDEVASERVRLLPTDPRDMVPSAMRWARTLHATIRSVPRAQLPAPSRTSLQAVVWVLAAAADYDNHIPPDHTAAILAREAGVGDRVWQNAPHGCASGIGSSTVLVGPATAGS
jgi:hypothetical protein